LSSRHVVRRLSIGRILHLVPFLLVAGLIFLYSTDTLTAQTAIDRIESDILSGRVADDSRVWNLAYRTLTTLRHIIAFLLLGLSAYPLQRRRADSARYALMACGAVALGSEFFQGLYTSIRKPTVVDIAVDLSAAGAGLGVLYILRTPEVKKRVAWLLRLPFLGPLFSEYGDSPLPAGREIPNESLVSE
jgi:hypothetical protein